MRVHTVIFALFISLCSFLEIAAAETTREDFNSDGFVDTLSCHYEGEGIGGVMITLLDGRSSLPPCLMKPDYFDIRLPRHGFMWLEDEEFSGGCEDVPAKKWIRKPSGSFDLFVYADGPSGSGRYWNITIGVAKRQQSKPIRGICLMTSTVGWRTLQQYKNSPLAWLDDLDGDGKAELIIWTSFPLREESSMAEFGLMGWVFRVASEDSLVIDWVLSRKLAREIAESYRSPLDSATPYPGTLRAEAAEALQLFVDERCTIPTKGAR